MRNKILLFESEQTSPKNIGAQIYSWGYQLIRVKTADELLSNVSNEEVAVIVLDSTMSDDERIDLLTRIRMRHRDIPTVIFSACFGQKIMREAGRLKIVAFIPYTSTFNNPESTLRTTLDSICRKN